MPLGDLPDMVGSNVFDSRANKVEGDYVVGRSFQNERGDYVTPSAFIHKAGLGMVNLKQYLADQEGLDIGSCWLLTEALDIQEAPDGSIYIVGDALNRTNLVMYGFQPTWSCTAFRLNSRRRQRVVILP